MRFDVLTIFSEMFSAYLREGILGRAVKREIVDIRLVNIRDFAKGAHKTTDDRPYGGGDGMVMKPGPIYRSLESVERVKGRSLVILLSPQGESFDQAMAWELSEWDQLILVCGRYEGVDERIRLTCVDREISIGDYVLSGGELGAMVIMDAVSRLIPGVLGGETSNLEDSFEGGLLEYPQFTRPRVFQEKEVPPVLLSGDHERIRLWRRTESLKRTLEKRPDLLEKAGLTPEDKELLAKLKKERNSAGF
ncbi:MAG: tRNA (guanosine(37)-N1)-methyltransferase TrmD [Deltaproteobacteria bacterium]|nr:tRNA (guanosine(37)-N1)-methyltransferase TrmD [Deltaproteobacteria bacterium]MBW2118606.1 tRNA (guanosine(37)-N1)-methyltransferase TrmD [Deltaproteobacteria bacterium]MBW2344747.1 tRNA (guanosine(37)-N1)-methyltransferase TrmD [Deltaproteobacteria bacterium]